MKPTAFAGPALGQSNFRRARPLAAKTAALALGLFLSVVIHHGRAQANSISENFGDGSGDGNTVTLPTGWSTINLSQDASTTISGGLPGPWSAYSITDDGAAGLDLSVAPAGSDASYALDGFLASTDTSDPGIALSDWLITPSINLTNGAILTFLTQSANPGGSSDVLEVDLAQAPSSAVAVASLAGGDQNTAGLFITDLLTLGSLTTQGLYPQTTADGGWVAETVTLSGLPAGLTVGNIAFRYESSDNTDTSYIGVADVHYALPLSEVPEPSTPALMLVGAGLLLLARRRCGFNGPALGQSNLRRARPLAAKTAALALGLFLSVFIHHGQAQANSISENFGDGSGDGNTVVLPTGWSTINLSQDASTTISGGLPGPWSAYSTSADGPTGLDLIIAPAGTDASYALDGFLASTDTSDPGIALSDWLITPSINLTNGATLTFLTQSANPGGSSDVLEVDLAQASSSAVAVASLSGGDQTTTGLFTTNLLTLGSLTTQGLYPQTASNGGWVTETVTLSGLPAGLTVGNLAFRYESSDNTNTSYIGVADVSYTVPVTMFHTQGTGSSGTPLQWADPAAWQEGVAPTNGGSVAIQVFLSPTVGSNFLTIGAANYSLNQLTVQAGTTGAWTLAGTGTLTFNNAGALFEDASSTSLATQTVIAPNLDLSVATTFQIDNAGGSTLLTGGISGSTLTKTGLGTLIIAGADTTTSTTISAGTLQIGNGSTTGSVSGSISDGGALVFDLSNGISYAGTITGGGTLTQAGSDTLTLSGPNAYGGGTTINSGGTLQAESSTALGTSTVMVASGGSLQVSGGTTLSSNNNITISGTGVGGTGAIFSSDGDFNGVGGTVTLANDASIDNANAADEFTFTGSVSLSTHTLTLGGSGQVELSGQVSGSGALTVGSGRGVVMDGSTANIYSGLTTVMGGGNLYLQKSSDVTSVPGDLSISGTVTDYATGQLATTSVVTLSGSGEWYFVIPDTSESIAGLSGISSTTVVEPFDAGGGNTLTLGGSGTYSYAGQINDNPAPGPGPDTTFALVKQGTGTQTLSGTNNYSGGTTLAGGILQAGSSTALGTGTISFTGGTLQYGVGITQDFSNQFSNAAGQLYSIDTNGNDVTFATALTSSTGTLTKLGLGDLTLSNAETYGGLTTVTAGTLTFTGDTSGLGGAILDNAALVFNQAADSSFSNGISGSGALTKQGAGNLTLGNANTYGGLTTVTAGTLTFTGDTSGLGGAIVDNAALVFNQAASSSFSNGISGNGTLTKQGAGNLTLGNANTYGGLTTVTAGTLTFTGDTSGLGGAILDNAALVFNQAASSSFSNGISGNGTLTKLGAGNLTLGNANTYGGLTTVTAGTLTFTGDTSGLGGAILDNAALVFNQAVNSSFSNGISGNGTLTKLGAGNLTLGNANTYGGLTTVTAGTLTFTGDTSGLGGAILDNAALVFNQAANSSFSNGISGSGTLTKLGAGNLTLGGTNSYGGLTTVTAGTLTFTGSTSGLGGAIVDNAALVFNQAASSSFSNGISGSGTLTKQGAGNLTLGGTNSYGGLTTVTAGTLTFTGDTSGLGGAILDNAAVVFNQAANSSFSHGISGTGSLTQQGAGTLTLSGANSYQGGTTISAGTLAIGNPGALGNGPVSLTGGTLTTALGNHVITVNGNYNQGVNGTLVLNLTSPAVYDSVNVTGGGVATLSGNLMLNLVGGFAPGGGQVFQVITTANPVVGKFTMVTTSIPSINATTNYTNNVTVLFQAPFATLPGLSLTSNQLAVARYIDAHDLLITNPGFAALIAALNGISVDPQGLAGAFDQLTPLKFENFASSNAFNNTSFFIQQFDNYLAGHRGPDGTFVGSNGGLDYSGLTVNDPDIDSGLQMVHSRLLAWSPAPGAGLLSDTADLVLGGVDMKDMKACSACEPANLWNVFITGDVVLAQDFSDPSAGLAHTDATTGAVQLGADYKFTPHFLVGAMFGYGHTDATLDTLGSKASVDTYSPGVYASYSNGGWYANALGSYGFADYDQDRNVSIGAFSGTAHSSPGGDQIVGNLDGGYDFHCGHWTAGPTLGLQYVHLDVDGFTETGLPGNNLTVNRSESDSLRSNLGGRLAYAIQDGGMTFTPHLNASWQHEFLDQSRGITSQFADPGIGSGSFVVATSNPSRDSALADLGFDAAIDQTWTVFTDYTVQAGQSNYFGQSVQAGVKIGF